MEVPSLEDAEQARRPGQGRTCCRDGRAGRKRHTRLAIAGAAMRAIDTIPLDTLSTQVREWAMAMRHLHESRMATSKSSDNISLAHRAELSAQRELSMRVLWAQRQELNRLHHEDGVAEGVLQEFEIEFDLAEIALNRLAWNDPQSA